MWQAENDYLPPKDLPIPGIREHATFPGKGDVGSMTHINTLRWGDGPGCPSRLSITTVYKKTTMT